MKPFSEMRDDELAAALHSLRPEPSPAFAAELDQRVAAGFPRRSRALALNPFARFRTGKPRRLVLGAGFATIVAVAAVATVIAASSGGGSSDSDMAMQRGAVENGSMLKAAPSAGAAEGEAARSYSAEAIGGGNSGNGAAADTTHRSVERSSQIVIGTKPGDVAEASSKVFETVHNYDGIVLNSSTQNGSGTNAEASFELLIPSGKVGDAMAAFSRIGEVVNRHEATTDITAPTVGTSERLQDSEARIEGLLAQLSESTTEPEREVVEAELDAERRHAAHLKSKLSDLHRRANLSRVSVRIVSGKGAVAPGGSGEDESWGIGSALDDAGHLLSVAAGVTIVGLAVLSPLLLLALLVWLAGRAWTRRARERALT